MKRITYRWAVLGALLVFTGCGGESLSGLVPAEGTVSMDGKPVAGATVTFLGGSYTAAARTDDSGKFVMYTRDQVGLAPGSYKVTVTKFPAPAEVAPPTTATTSTAPVTPPTGNVDQAAIQAAVDAQKAKQAAPANELPAKYEKKESTPLAFTVDKDGSKNKFAITLEP